MPEGGCMTIVTLDVRSPEDTPADLAQVCRTGQADSDPRIGFATPVVLWQVLTAERWELPKALAGQAPMS
jgi:predicted transcriptional regulator